MDGDPGVVGVRDSTDRGAVELKEAMVVAWLGNLFSVVCTVAFVVVMDCTGPCISAAGGVTGVGTTVAGDSLGARVSVLSADIVEVGT